MGNFGTLELCSAIIVSYGVSYICHHREKSAVLSSCQVAIGASLVLLLLLLLLFLLPLPHLFFLLPCSLCLRAMYEIKNIEFFGKKCVRQSTKKKEKRKRRKIYCRLQIAAATACT